MKIEFQKSHAFLSEAFAFKKPPSITTATRLETQPTAVNLKLGLQAPVADPCGCWRDNGNSMSFKAKTQVHR